ncbi:MAG: DUF2125 domain-containing protein [Pseudomonadota bacterium]
MTLSAKRIGTYAALVLAVLAIGWSVLWYLGRDQARAAVEAEVERLRAGGVDIAYAPVAIGGFPFGYDLATRDVAVSVPGRATLTLPTLSAAVSLFDTDRVDVTLPDTARLVLAPGIVATADPDAAVGIEILAEDATLVLTRIADAGEQFRAPGGATEVLLQAGGLSLAYDPAREGDPTAVGLQSTRLAFTGLAVAGRLPSGPEAPPATGDLRVAFATAEGRALSATPVGNDPDGPLETGRLDLQIADAGLSLSAYRIDPSDGASLFDATLRLGDTVIAVSPPRQAAALGPLRNKVFEIRADTVASTASLNDGVVATTLDFTAPAVMALEPPASLAAPLDRSDPMLVLAAAGVSFGDTRRRLPVPGVTPFEWRASGTEVAVGDVLWSLADPGGALTRTPAAFALVVEGQTDAAVSVHLPATSALSRAEGRFDLSMLGGEVAAELAIDLPGAGQASGQGSVTLTRSMPVLRDLRIAELIGTDDFNAAVALTERYARSGEDPDTLISDLSVRSADLYANGRYLMTLPDFITRAVRRVPGMPGLGLDEDGVLPLPVLPPPDSE